uniref:PRC-barrel domain-containing protein n=1 Tax=Chamaesiphon sp. VAR_69_metabat_338 TaxID=2964704 RepID=UPI00286EAA14
MVLHKIKDFNPDYKEHFGNREIKGLDVYTADEKIGSVEDVLVDDEGRFRYLVINTGAWIVGKKV